MSINAVSGSSSWDIYSSMKSQTDNKAKSVDEIFSQDDQDGDGLLSVEETPMDEASFTEADADGDGYLSEEELQESIDARMTQLMNQLNSGSFSADIQSQIEEMVSNFVSDKDTDGDGSLTQDESGMDDEMFASIDTDGDGVLSLEELQSDMQNQMGNDPRMMGGGPPPPPPEADFEDMASTIISDEDADGDGVLSLDETEFDEDKFAEIDTDGDGYLSQEEIQADLEANMPPPPMGGGGGGSDEDDDDDEDEVDSLEDLFTSADTDGDGVLSEEEYVADVESRMTSARESLLSAMFGDLEGQNQDVLLDGLLG